MHRDMVEEHRFHSKCIASEADLLVIPLLENPGIILLILWMNQFVGGHTNLLEANFFVKKEVHQYHSLCGRIVMEETRPFGICKIRLIFSCSILCEISTD